MSGVDINKKREEIREGVAESFYYFHGWDGKTKWEDVVDREIEYDFADASLRRLHSQGCVLEVDRKLPTTRVKGDVNWHDGFRHGQALMKRDGFTATVPLIEE